GGGPSCLLSFPTRRSSDLIAGIFQLADGAQVVAAHALRVLSDTKIPMVFAIFGYWAVGLPVAWVLGFVLDWRGAGIWLGLAAGLDRKSTRLNSSHVKISYA